MVDYFEELKKQKDWSRRNSIVKKILGIAKGAEVLTNPTIEALKREKHYLVKCALMEVLEKIGTDTAIEAIIPMLKDKSDYVVERALSHMSDNRTLATSQALREIVLKTKNEKHLKRALSSLYSRILDSNLETDSEINLDLIIEMINNSKYETLLSYIHRIGEISRKSYKEKILTTLKDISKKHKSEDFRQEASKVLEKLSNEIILIINNKECKIEENGLLEIPFLQEGVLPNVDWAGQAIKIKDLRIQHSLVKSLNGIEKLTELEVLSLQMTIMEGGAFVRKKTKLEDISALSKCPNLRKVNLSMNSIRDINGLANHPNLAVINLSDNEIDEIKRLTNLPKLTNLNLSKNNISRISGLDDLKRLYNLDLSYNKISRIEGLENLKRLLTIHLEENVSLRYHKPDDAQKLVAQCAGVSLGPEEQRDLTKINVHPFKHMLLLENVEDRCLYCKNNISVGENQREACEKQFEKMLSLKNSKIPKSITERKVVSGGSSMQVIGYKSTPNPYSSFTTKTVRTMPKTEKTKKLVGSFEGKIFHSLAGTVCKACSEKFLESVNKILDNINPKGSAESLQRSISEIEDSFNSEIKYWMMKI